MDWNLKTNFTEFVRAIPLVISLILISLFSNAVVSEAGSGQVTHWEKVVYNWEFLVLVAFSLVVVLFELISWKSSESKMEKLSNAILDQKTKPFPKETSTPEGPRPKEIRKSTRLVSEGNAGTGAGANELIVRATEAFRKDMDMLSDSEREAFKVFRRRFVFEQMKMAGIQRLGRNGGQDIFFFRIGPELRGVGYFDKAKKVLSLVQISRHD